MKRLSAVGLLCLVSALAQADEGEHTKGQVGALFVHGSLEVSCFTLTMESPWQEVIVGAASDSSRPVMLTLALQDFPDARLPHQSGRPVDYHAGKASAIYQARLTARTRTLDPQLISVQGAEDVGIKLRDSSGRVLDLAGRGALIPLTTGLQVVNFTLTPEKLTVDSPSTPYHTLATFSMDYF